MPIGYRCDAASDERHDLRPPVRPGLGEDLFQMRTDRPETDPVRRGDPGKRLTTGHCVDRPATKSMTY